MTGITRRRLLGGSLAAGAALWLPRARPLGASTDVRVACVGLKGQGRTHVKSFERLAGVRVVALCDVDPAVLAERADELDAATGRSVDRVVDVRRIMDRRDIDVVATATPNHWHALIGIWACQSGKDAYVEKPISHNVWEGRQLVLAARRYGRMVQGGTQSRSMASVQEAVHYLRQGELGAIERVRGLCYKPRMSIGKVGAGVIPDGLDYDLWTGPAPLRPLRRKSLHYDWHWIYDTGNGDMGNQGIHQMDVARWLLGADRLAPRVISIGGRLGYDDDGQTPNTQVVFHDYRPAPLIFETRGLPRSAEHRTGDWDAWADNMDRERGIAGKYGIGVVAECEHGSLVIDSGGRGVAYDRDHRELRRFEGGGDPYQNFIDAVRSRRRSDLHSECLETHLSSALCHTGLVSHLRGQAMSDGEILERIRGHRLLVDRYESMRDHLGRNGIDLTARAVTFGPMLEMDPETERFVGDHAADALLARRYRPPFAVPEQV